MDPVTTNIQIHILQLLTIVAKNSISYSRVPGTASNKVSSQQLETSLKNKLSILGKVL